MTTSGHVLRYVVTYGTLRFMAIYRRKRNGKFTGSWIWRAPDGTEVNLKTKDKVEARKRSELAEQGEWPRDAGKDARRAAGNLAAADEGPGAAIDAGPSDGESALPAADESPTGEGPGVVAERAASDSESAPVAGATADDLNAAAGAAADPVFDEMASAAGVTPDEMKAAVSDLMTDAPQLVAGLYLQVQAIGVRIGYHLAKGKRTQTALIPKPIPPEAPERRVLALGCKAALARLNLNIETIPWWAPLLVGMAWTCAVQVKSGDVVQVKPTTGDGSAQPPAPASA